MWQIWLIIAGACIIIEMFTVGFFVFWFAIGALIAMIASIFIHSIVIQSIIFLVSSTLLLFATKPFVNMIQKSSPNYKTNSASIEGENGIVVSEINPETETGQIRVKSEKWSAKSYNNTTIPEGTKVIIEKIEGVKAIVKPIE